ncbi:60S ribosomal protein L31, partial [Intoshia linei]
MVSRKFKSAMKPKKFTNLTVERDYTINIHRKIHGVGFKKRAPRAIKIVREFARKQMGTDDVRLDTNVNSMIWERGI